MTEQDTKTQILQAASAVFSRKGFAGASMNDVVRASGLSKGGVYWHFESKDDLIVAIFEQAFTGQIAQLEAALAEPGPATDKLLQLAASLGQETQAWMAEFPYPIEFYALAARNEALKKQMSQYFQGYERHLVALVQQGVDLGEFRAVDPVETAVSLIGIFEGILLLWVLQPGQIDLAGQVKAAVRLLLDGLRRD